MTSIKIPEELKKVDEIFSSHGYKAYLVGGAVRDMILGKKGHDWDLPTNTTPKQVRSIFKKVIRSEERVGKECRSRWSPDH